MTTSWDNRVKFLVRYMFDLDNNGYLNQVNWKEWSGLAKICNNKHVYFQPPTWSSLERIVSL